MINFNRCAGMREHSCQETIILFKSDSPVNPMALELDDGIRRMVSMWRNAPSHYLLQYLMTPEGDPSLEPPD